MTNWRTKFGAVLSVLVFSVTGATGCKIFSGTNTSGTVEAIASPTPTATESSTPDETASPTPSATPTETASPTPSATPSPSPSPAAAVTYTVTPSGSNVTISPATAQTVNSAATTPFTVTASGGYTLSASVTGTCPAGSWNGSAYTTGAITANCTVIFSSSVTAKKIFITARLNVYGNLGGVVGADAICASDVNKPSGGGTYKAMLTATTRIACTTANCSGGPSEHTDWVLAASTSYERGGDGAPLGTTTANAIFSFPLTNSIYPGTTDSFLTGLHTSWTKRNDTCLNWTSDSGGVYAATGYSNVTTSQAIWDGGFVGCDFGYYRLYCVEQ